MRILKNIIRKRTKKLKCYTSLDTLKILTFWTIIKDNNYLLLDKNYTPDTTYTPKQHQQLSTLWLELYDAYFLLTNDAKTKRDLDLKFKELSIISKITELKNNYDYLLKLKEYNGILPVKTSVQLEQDTYQRITLIDKRLKPKPFAGLDANLKRIEKFILALTNSYNQIQASLKKIPNQQIENIYKVVANAESWLERNININTMVVSHWVALQQQIQQKQQAQKQQHGK